MNDKIRSTLYYLASACFYIVAVIHFWSKNTSGGILWICLGSAFLCLGGVALGKKSDEKKDPDKK